METFAKRLSPVYRAFTDLPHLDLEAPAEKGSATVPLPVSECFGQDSRLLSIVNNRAKENQKPKSCTVCITLNSYFLKSLWSGMVDQEHLADISYLIAVKARNDQVFPTSV